HHVLPQQLADLGEQRGRGVLLPWRFGLPEALAPLGLDLVPLPHLVHSLRGRIRPDQRSFRHRNGLGATECGLQVQFHRIAAADEDGSSEQDGGRAPTLRPPTR
ncbi:unnamed protein product, partial [Symbiodinium sp. KB8]